MKAGMARGILNGSNPAVCGIAQPSDLVTWLSIHALVRQRSPLRRHALGAALRQREDREGRIGSAGGGEDAWSGYPEIWNFVALAIAVDDGIGGAGAHDGPAHQMAGGDRAARRPCLLGAAGLRNLQSHFEIGVP